MSTDTIQTSIGPAQVLHRLALGLVLRDAVTDRDATAGLRVGWEASGHFLPRGATPEWPCVDFERVGAGRFRLRVAPRPAGLTVRVSDASRRYVPRRFTVPWWTQAQLTDPVPANALSVVSRTLRLWLWPGAAYPLPTGTTAIRGRIMQAGIPVPWARITARGTTGAILGLAHGDDRGEFRLVLTDIAQNPVQSSVTVRLVLRGPATAPVEPPDDGLVDPPPAEVVTRPGNPPNLPGDLDNDLLRGITPPAALVPSVPPPPQFTVPVGRETVIATNIPFHP
jgi:hypothetical protein